ncbi:MAG: response regulator [Desulfobacterales bacterium]|nr:response regulator [Desulfobacterales bacterium]
MDTCEIEEKLKRESEINAAMAEIAHKLISSATVDEISELFLEYSKKFTTSKYGFVGYIDPKTGYLISKTMTKDVWEKCNIEHKTFIFDKFLGLWGWVLTNKKAILVNNLITDGRSTGIPKGHIPIEKFLSAPAIFRDKTENLLGTIALANPDRDYTNEDLSFVEKMADLYAITIHQKRIQDELVESFNNLDAIFQAIPGYVMALDKNFNIIDLSDNMLAIIDLDKKDIIGKKCYEVYKNKNDICANCHVLIAMETGEVSTRLSNQEENNLFGQSLKFYASPIKDKNGNINGAVNIGTDISDIKFVQEAFKKAKIEADSSNKAKNLFLANMSHEIRTPINGIIGMAEILLARLKNLSDREHVEIIYSSANTLLNIMNDILDYSKIESKNLKLNLTDFDIVEFIESTAKVFSIEAQRKGIKLSLNIDPNIPTHLNGDSERLGQILRNLLTNAIKFTSEGEIKLGTDKESEDDNYVDLLFYVNDTGIGIPEDKWQYLFQSFFQVNSSYSKQFGGSGLGLAISKQLVKMMGGDIWLERKKDSQGSLFKFTCRLAKSNLKSEKKQNIQMKIHEKRLKILVAEDNPINLEYIDFLLKEMGHEVFFANDGQEALKSVYENKFDLIFMDIQMPNLDGVEATIAIRKWEQEKGKKRIPIIALTAYTSRSDKENFISAGMDAHLSKPLRPKDLSQMLDKIIYDFKLDVIDTNIKMDEHFEHDDTLKRFNGNIEFLEKLRTKFINSVIPDHLDRIKNAVESHDKELLIKVVHSLKGACGTIGANKAFNLTKDIIDLARKDKLTDAIEIASVLKRELLDITLLNTK